MYSHIWNDVDNENEYTVSVGTNMDEVNKHDIE